LKRAQRTGLRQSGRDRSTILARVHFQPFNRHTLSTSPRHLQAKTDASVTIRPGIPTPIQRVTAICAETDVLQPSAAAGTLGERTRDTGGIKILVVLLGTPAGRPTRRLPGPNGVSSPPLPPGIVWIFFTILLPLFLVQAHCLIATPYGRPVQSECVRPQRMRRAVGYSHSPASCSPVRGAKPALYHEEKVGGDAEHDQDYKEQDGCRPHVFSPMQRYALGGPCADEFCWRG
jgi:hypothetical protein